MEDKTRYEAFVADCKVRLEDDVEVYRDSMRDNGQFAFAENVKELIRFARNAKPSTMVYLYGEQLGMHYWDKLVNTYNRNVLQWIAYLDEESQFYFLHEINRNSNIQYY